MYNLWWCVWWCICKVKYTFCVKWALHLRGRGIIGVMKGNPGNPIQPDNTGKQYRTMKINHQAQMFATFYMSPTSDTFMNVRQSALRAGYSEQYANNITVQRPKWWIDLPQPRILLKPHPPIRLQRYAQDMPVQIHSVHE